MSILLLLLLLTATSHSMDEINANNNNIDNEAFDSSSTLPTDASTTDGRSFFFFGTIFRRFRDRWLAYHNSVPLYAGPAFPINGYYNCPVYGCNPAMIGPQPPLPSPIGGGAFPINYYPNGYYPPLGATTNLQQQETQGQAQSSNVYIYQNEQNPGYFPPPPPAPPQPAVTPNGIQGYRPTFIGGPLTPILASASSTTPIGGNACGPATYPCNFG